MNKKKRSMVLASFIGLLLLVFWQATSLAQDDDRSESEIVKQVAAGQIQVEELTTLTPNKLARALVGPGIIISNVKYTGSNIAAGKFSNADTPIGIDAGVILSSGQAKNVIGPNVSDGISTNLGQPGDADLNSISTGDTQDAAVLEFDFVPAGTYVSFAYVFASDEYNEYVNSLYNDVFAFYINGVNCATIGGNPVSINSIHGGNPYNPANGKNAHLFRNNDLNDKGGNIDTEMDGLTKVLICNAAVNENEVNHIKLAIADVTDSSLDSNVFINRIGIVDPPESVPEPMTMVLFGSGIAALGAYVHRRKRQDTGQDGR